MFILSILPSEQTGTDLAVALSGVLSVNPRGHSAVAGQPRPALTRLLTACLACPAGPGEAAWSLGACHRLAKDDIVTVSIVESMMEAVAANGLHAGQLEGLAGFVGALPAGLVEGAVVPAVERAIRRSSELGVLAVRALLGREMKADLSRSLGTLLNALLAPAKAEAEPVRARAAEAFELVVSRCGTAEAVLEHVVAPLAKAVAGGPKATPYVFQRIGVAGLLGAAAAAGPSAAQLEAAGVTRAALEALLAVAEQDPAPDCRVAALGALARWGPRVAGAADAAVLAAGLARLLRIADKEKDMESPACRAAALEVALAATSPVKGVPASGPHVAGLASSQPLIAALVATATRALPRQALQGESLAAVAVLSTLSEADLSVKATAAKTIDALLETPEASSPLKVEVATATPESTTTTTTTTATTTSSLLVVQVRAIAALLRAEMLAERRRADRFALLSRGLLSAALQSGHSESRKEALLALRHAPLAARPALAEALLDLVTATPGLAHAHHLARVVAIVATPERPLHSAALLSLVSGSPRQLLSRQERVFSRRLHGASLPAAPATVEEVDLWVKSARAGSLGALLTAAHRAAAAADSICAWAVSELTESEAEMSEWVAQDYGVYWTPEGVLYRDEDAWVPPQVDAIDRRGKSEEEIWEETVRRELEAKKKAAAAGSSSSSAAAGKGKGTGKGKGPAGAAGAATVDKVTLERLAVESAKRAAMGVVLRRAKTALEVAGTLLEGVAATSRANPVLAKLAPLLSHKTFLASPVTRGVAMASLRALGAASVGDRGGQGGQGDAVGEALGLIRGGVEDLYSASVKRKPPHGGLPNVPHRVSHAVRILSQRAGPCPGPVLSALVPIVEEVVFNRDHYNSQDFEAAIRFLGATVSSPEGLDGPSHPRPLLISILLQSIFDLAVVRDAAKELLSTAAQYLTVEECVQSLLEGVLVESLEVREATLMALRGWVSCAGPFDNRPSSAQQDLDPLAAHLWLARYDPEPALASSAELIWKASGLSAELPLVRLTVTYFSVSSALYVREAGARALAGLAALGPSLASEAVSALMELHASSLRPRPRPPSDNVALAPGLVAPPPDPEYLEALAAYEVQWCARHGVGLALKALSRTALSAEDLSLVVTFVSSSGLTDQEEDVRKAMMMAGVELVAERGSEHLGTLLPMFENILAQPVSGSVTDGDRIREGVAIFLGSIARFLPAKDPKVTSAVDRLLDALATPSESVQLAVAQCLPALVPLVPDVGSLASRLVEEVLRGETYARRVGAAHGLAALVKGSGIGALKQHGIMAALLEIADEKNTKSTKQEREGTLLAVSQLSSVLGRLFEPYVIQVLPFLLTSFGDNDGAVKNAARAASRAVMAQLTGHGVKLILPAVLKGLDDPKWRIKAGSIDLLGVMAFCAPKQLSSCLPTVVPAIVAVLSDSNQNVNSAARAALRNVGSVIKNPEILTHVPALLHAIMNPTEGTKAALEALIHTDFVHSIDAPSLALIVPVLLRGLRSSGTEVRKRTVQIVGSICSLADAKDVVPYVPQLLPEIKTLLFDPIPEVRTFCAHALGSLVRGMGEEHFGDLIPWLLATLVSDASTVERSGAAQGIGEVIRSTDVGRLTAIIPQIAAFAADARATARDGALGLFIFLPPIIGDKLSPHLGTVIPMVLHGLSDEAEPVRETALRAGRTLVTTYGAQHVGEMAGLIQAGIFSPSHRIRLASVQLMGDLLRTVAGHAMGRKLAVLSFEVGNGGDEATAAQAVIDQRAQEGIEETLASALGRDRRDTYLASVYMTRSDVSPVVRQTGYLVWKSIVSHTTRSLREVLPKLMELIIEGLSGTGNAGLGGDEAREEAQEIAGRCLGDLVSKLGDRILEDIVPILLEGLRHPGVATRQGTCLGLSEVLQAAKKLQILPFMPVILPAIRASLTDPEESVREAAAQSFAVLHNNIGSKALDEILLPLLESLDGEIAVDAVRQLMAVKGAVVLPYLVPKLVGDDMSAFQARALGTLVEAAGDALDLHVVPIVPCLFRCARSHEGQEAALAEDEVVAAARKVALNLGPAGVMEAVTEVAKGLFDGSATVRAASARFFAGLCGNPCAAGLADEIMALSLGGLLRSYMDKNMMVLAEAAGALDQLLKLVPKEQLPESIDNVRQTIHTMVVLGVMKRTKASLVPGFCQPRGLTPLVPMFLQGLMFGTPEMREKAAMGISDLVGLTDPENLRPYVVQLTGPLIRILGDRFPWQVKSAILQSLSLLLPKAGPVLKPFVPQLQTTFVKALTDPAREVRDRAVAALVLLVPLSPRVEQLATDLHGQAAGLDGELRETVLGALGGLLGVAGDKVPAATRATILKTASQLVSQDAIEDESMRVVLSRIIGVAASLADAPTLESLSSIYLFPPAGNPDWERRHFDALCLRWYVRAAAALGAADQDGASRALRARVLARAAVLEADDKVAVQQVAVAVLSELLVRLEAHPALEPELEAALRQMSALAAEPQANELKVAVCDAIRHLAKRNLALALRMQGVILPALAPVLKSANMPTRLAAERSLMYSLDIVDGGFDGALANIDKALLPADYVRSAPDLIRKLSKRITEEVWVGSDDEGEN